MKKHILFLLFTIMSFSLLSGCSNSGDATKTDIGGIVEEVLPTPTIDPNLLESQDDFVLYKDGSNNYVDDLDGYEKATSIPEKYNNYETLLNHSGNYNNQSLVDFSTIHITYDVIATYENANEVSYRLGDYEIRTILPVEITKSDVLYENENMIESTNEYRLYSILESNDCVVYNGLYRLGNNIETNDFLKIFYGNDLEKWEFFLGDIFIPITNDSGSYNYEFVDNENFMSITIDTKMNITYFEEPYIGKLIVNIDKFDGSFIYTFIGYKESVYLNDTNTSQFNKENVLNSFVNLYKLQIPEGDREGCI